MKDESEEAEGVKGTSVNASELDDGGPDRGSNSDAVGVLVKMVAAARRAWGAANVGGAIRERESAMSSEVGISSVREDCDPDTVRFLCIVRRVWGEVAYSSYTALPPERLAPSFATSKQTLPAHFQSHPSFCQLSNA